MHKRDVDTNYNLERFLSKNNSKKTWRNIHSLIFSVYQLLYEVFYTTNAIPALYKL